VVNLTLGKQIQVVQYNLSALAADGMSAAAEQALTLLKLITANWAFLFFLFEKFHLVPLANKLNRHPFSLCVAILHVASSAFPPALTQPQRVTASQCLKAMFHAAQIGKLAVKEPCGV
jgi:hypothetical protein